MADYLDPEDPRIGLLLAYLEHVKERASSGAYSDVNRKALVEALEALESRVQSVRYSYMPPSDVVESIEPEAKRLLDLLEDVEEPELRWLAEYLEGLLGSFLSAEVEDEADAVPCVAVRVVDVRDHPRADGLKVTVVDAGEFSKRTVVTNLEDVSEGDVMALALLPPREFSGVVSEGMFCGDPGDVEPGSRIEPPERGEVRSVVMEWLSGKIR